MEKLLSIPSLRFSGFSEEWTQKQMKNLTTRISNPVNVSKDQMYQQIGIRSHGKGIFIKEPVTGLTLGEKRVFWIVEDALILNIVFAWEQAVAKTTRNEIGKIASHRFPMYLPIDKKSDLDFLLFFFLTKKGKSLLELASPGGAGRNKTLGQKEFENLKLIVPTSFEQRKISSFLIKVDEKLSQLIKKKSLLEKYKIGILQRVLSQELRFLDDAGVYFPAWHKRKIGEVLTIGSGRDFKHLAKGEVPVYGTGGIMTYVDSWLYDGETVCIGRKGTIDKPMFYSGKIWTVDTLFYSHSFIGTIPKFIFYIFQSINWKEHNEASGVPSLSKSIIEKIPISIPSLPEQQKIASFLSALDDKIAQTALQIEKMQLWKKGLLQQMFV